MTQHSRIAIAIPTDYVIPRPKTPEPPPVPGTVSAEDLQPPKDPPRPFLTPWSTHSNRQREANLSNPIPAEVDREKLAAFLDRHPVEATALAVFKDQPEMAEAVVVSMSDPFRSNDSEIVWTLTPKVQPNPSVDDRLGGKKLKNRHRILRGAPWSIATFVDADTGVVRRNMIYGGDGDAIAQIDFGHGQSCGIHCHALVKGNLEHTAASQDDHAFPMLEVPWMWLCVPLSDRSGLHASSLPTTVDRLSYCCLSVPFEDFSEMGAGDRTDSM
eukprot:CAMPEP_0174855690 /NCGR_PEP_ID=MMETSP1114-20130205/33962_1 /TAXON_ID=312471 /ORGANISM="Neobodo designis, Strain CCAP 1951/1" /LENGTH=270 /DNA_ID=CAMNT_0016090441 /DNA_START=35 /DNA_END=847 /DNA_ORIENTATION=+